MIKTSQVSHDDVISTLENLKNGTKEMVYTPIHFPDHGAYIAVKEPWILLTIIVPHDYVSNLMQLFLTLPCISQRSSPL